MDLMVVGTVAFDSVETPFGKREETLGGSASFLGTVAAYFCPVRLVGVIGEDFPEAHLDFFKTRRIDISGLERSPGKTFRWSGFYGADLNSAETRETQLNVLADFDPKIPDSYRSSKLVVLGNFDPKLQKRVLEQLEGPKLVAADTMNFWIEGMRPELLEVLKHVDLLSVNDGEARQLSGEYNLVKAAHAIQEMGPRIVVIKRGEHGATVFNGKEIFMAPAFPILTIQDPTGAGDSFAGGMLGYLARHESIDDTNLRQAVVMGSVMASYAVEDFSLDRFRELNTRDIKNRFEKFKSLTHFEIDGAKFWDD